MCFVRSEHSFPCVCFVHVPPKSDLCFGVFAHNAQSERARKEMIYRTAVEYLNKGHFYEKSVLLLQELQVCDVYLISSAFTHA